MSRISATQVAAVLGVAAAGAMATVALAEPGVGVASQTLVQAAPFNDEARVNHDRIKFQTKDPTDVYIQKLTFAPNSLSGWHHHPGLLIVAVKTGTVTLTTADCVSKTYGPGQPDGSVFTEGDNHPVQASSSSGAEAYVTVVVPRGERAREDDVPQSC